jgi:hypothetical protein
MSYEDYMMSIFCYISIDNNNMFNFFNFISYQLSLHVKYLLLTIFVFVPDSDRKESINYLSH